MTVTVKCGNCKERTMIDPTSQIYNSLTCPKCGRKLLNSKSIQDIKLITQ